MFNADDFDYEEAVKRFFKNDLENSIQDDGISDINLSVETKKPIPDGAYVPEEWSGGNNITSDELWKWLDLLDPDKGADLLKDVPEQLQSVLSDSGSEVPLGSMVFTVDFSEMGKPEFRGAYLTKDNRLAIDYKVDNVRIASPHTKMEGLLKKLREQLEAADNTTNPEDKRAEIENGLDHVKSELRRLADHPGVETKYLATIMREYSVDEILNSGKSAWAFFADVWNDMTKLLLNTEAARVDIEDAPRFAHRLLTYSIANNVFEQGLAPDDSGRGGNRDREDFGADNIAESEMAAKNEGEWLAWAKKQLAYTPPENKAAAIDSMVKSYRRTEFSHKPPEQIRAMLQNLGESVGKPEGGNPAAALDEELSRKYYVAIAQILKDNKEWDAILQALIGLFKSDNPRFSADRFAQAAGASPELELGEVDGKPSPSNSAPKTNPQGNKDRAAADRDFEHDLHKGFKTPPPQHQAAFDAAYKRVAQGLTKWTRNV